MVTKNVSLFFVVALVLISTNANFVSAVERFGLQETSFCTLASIVELSPDEKSGRAGLEDHLRLSLRSQAIVIQRLGNCFTFS